MITMDVVTRMAPGLSESQVVGIGRISTVGLLLVAVLWAPQLAHFPSLWQYLQGVLAYAVPPIVALFVVGLFWRGANAAAAAVTLLIGSLSGLGLFLANTVLHWTHLHFLYVAPILLMIDTAILVSTSLLTRRRSADAGDTLTWTPAFFRAENLRLRSMPLWRDYRLHAVVLLLLTACVVVVFR
jgi:SSS family solute:Na+ symporter